MTKEEMFRMNKSVLIIEDHRNSMEMLVQIVESVDRSVGIKTVSNEGDAYIMAFKNKIALFLVDVVLNPSNPGDVSGMNFAYRIRKTDQYRYTPIIFVTALEDSKLYAYSDIHCYYYLEKPFDRDKAVQVISEALKFPQTRTEFHDVFFRKDSIFYKRDISEVVYIENTRLKQIVHLVDGKLELQYKPCKIILMEIQSERLLQCSRNLIVNKDYIDLIDPVSRYIKLKDGYGQIDIGISFKKNFMREIRNG